MVELGTDEHVKKIIFIEKLTEFYLSYVRVLVSMESGASIKIRHRCIAIVCAQSAVAHLEGNQTASSL